MNRFQILFYLFIYLFTVSPLLFEILHTKFSLISSNSFNFARLQKGKAILWSPYITTGLLLLFYSFLPMSGVHTEYPIKQSPSYSEMFTPAIIFQLLSEDSIYMARKLGWEKRDRKLPCWFRFERKIYFGTNFPIQEQNIFQILDKLQTSISRWEREILELVFFSSVL